MNVVQKEAFKLILSYLANNPMERLPAMLDLAEKLDRGNLHGAQIRLMREKLTEEGGVWNTFARRLFDEVQPGCIKKLLECFFIYGTLDSGTVSGEVEKKYDINVPWAILMDPTSACNLECVGCWAAEYGDKHNMSYETLDSIINQGKEIGIHFYIYSGGEPLVRKKDIIKLAEKHQDCYFFAFTNGTLVDEQFCEDVKRVCNFTCAFSIEGDEAATDMRRGQGTYKKVIAAMDLMRKHKLPFGYSTCYHAKNAEQIGSDEFVDEMIARGCRFSWNFTYIPVGMDAPADLLATPEQRLLMHKRIREIRDTKPVFAMDFWNDGEYTKGCIAGGRRYLHINAAGDVEPCAFVHYSNVNIHDVTLLEALQSPIFKAYRQNQPFNDNHMRPCPLLDNPDTLEKMVKESGAHSTDMEAPEPIEHLIGKTKKRSVEWGKASDPIWAEHVKEKTSKTA